jgi:hypothetical protein
MATIKTTGTGTGLRILTKTADGVQRVSCSCCGTFCCVFPASCGKGPQSIIHYGVELQETSLGSLTYGDAQNGLALVDGQWIIYRDGLSRSQTCLGANFDDETISSPIVGAFLASTYAVDVFYDGNLAVSTTVTFFGFSPATNENCGGGNAYSCDFVGQCAWYGSASYLTDEGIAILFNKTTCRWELQSGPLNFLFAFLEGSEQQSPIGTYDTVGMAVGHSIVVS